MLHRGLRLFGKFLQAFYLNIYIYFFFHKEGNTGWEPVVVSIVLRVVRKEKNKHFLKAKKKVQYRFCPHLPEKASARQCNNPLID